MDYHLDVSLPLDRLIGTDLNEKTIRRFKVTKIENGSKMSRNDGSW